MRVDLDHAGTDEEQRKRADLTRGFKVLLSFVFVHEPIIFIFKLSKVVGRNQRIPMTTWKIMTYIQLFNHTF